MNSFRWFGDRWRVFADWSLQLALTIIAIYAVVKVDKRELYWVMAVFGCLYLVRLLLFEIERLIWKKDDVKE